MATQYGSASTPLPAQARREGTSVRLEYLSLRSHAQAHPHIWAEVQHLLLPSRCARLLRWCWRPTPQSIAASAASCCSRWRRRRAECKAVAAVDDDTSAARHRCCRLCTRCSWESFPGLPSAAGLRLQGGSSGGERLVGGLSTPLGGSLPSCISRISHAKRPTQGWTGRPLLSKLAGRAARLQATRFGGE